MLCTQQCAVLVRAELGLVVAVDFVQIVPAHAASRHCQHHGIEVSGRALEWACAPPTLLLVEAGNPSLAVQLRAGSFEKLLQRIADPACGARQVTPPLVLRPLGRFRQCHGRQLCTDAGRCEQLRHRGARRVATVEREVLRAHVSADSGAFQFLPVGAHAATRPTRLLPDLDVNLPAHDLPQTQGNAGSSGPRTDYEHTWHRHGVPCRCPPAT
mmetsp:Transcript_65847/g.182469  ORF Transcript_65847/g.182469 Transcript_65847/m.182469 type:complete len:213 (-) Transcript_65847:46-684(-)